MPTHIGKYEVEAEIGHGSVVRMFRSRDRDTGRRVTLKVLAAGRDRRLINLFRHEIAAAAGLRHKNIVAIYELGDHEGLPFAAAQHLDGADLRHAIQRHTELTLLQKLTIMWQVGEGLRAAHHGGLSYVGVRPSGVVLADGGSATIQDFSIARVLGDGEEEYLAYASPEEIAGGFSPDTLCDIFAIGVLYYELLTGVHPFPSQSGVESHAQEPVPLRSLAPEVPEALEQLVHRAVHRHRELRYQNVDDVQDDAAPILSDLKRARATTLVVSARDMQRTDPPEPDLDHLQNVIREALELDPGNQEARQLQGSIRATQQRRALEARVATLFREADEQAAARRFAHAVEILNSALRLDASSLEAQSRLDAMCKRLEQYQNASQLVSDARRLMVEESLAEAHAKCAEAIAADPGHREAAELLASIGESIERRAREARIEQALARADSLLQAESYDAAISLLLELRTECGESPLVDGRLADARAQKAEQERRIHLGRELSEVDSLMTLERFEEALSKLTVLSAEFPEDATVAALREQAREAVKRTGLLADVKARCGELCRLEDFANALTVIDTALASYAGEPTLLALRHEVEEQGRAAQVTAATRRALDEAQWLLDQNRPDLAAAFLRGKTAELPQLAARLEAVEQMMLEWEHQRLVQDTLGRVAALEQSQQWSVALALIEPALLVCPASEELLDAGKRLRSRQQEEERRRKLARRLETIRQKIAVEAWPQALSLAELAQKEFCQEPELEQLCEEARAGMRRFECESVVAEVRQCLADGETARAEDILSSGLATLSGEPALERLREELEAGKKYREDWRTAQDLFGRRQFREAEEILSQLARPDRPDARALLETVRAARAASEEDDFFKRGREQALKLIDQKQFDQAADLLQNLLTLFPGDSILARDLELAEAGLEKPERLPDPTPPAAEPAPEPISRPAPVVVMPKPEPAQKAAGPANIVWVAVAILLILLSAGLAIWKFWPSRRAIAWTATPRPAVAQAHVIEASARVPTHRNVRETPVGGQPKPKQMPTPAALPFTPPTEVRSEATRAQVQLPAPVTDPLTTRQEAPGISTLPMTVLSLPSPTPPPAPTPVAPTPDPSTPVVPTPAAPTPVVQEPAAARLGGSVVEPKIISHPAPAFPPLSALRGIYGNVVLEATVDPTGAVKELKVVSGQPILAAAAKSAVAKWRYEPGTLNGRPTTMKVRIQVSFQNRK